MPKGILDGIRVLDMTVFQLGPVSTLMLALMGAEVIKIEVPGGEPGRVGGEGAVHGGKGKGSGGTSLGAYFETNNHCKKSIVLDLKRQKARDIVYQLVAKSDVFVQNISPGSAEKLGVGYEVLKKINPRLIYCTGTSFGTKDPDGLKPGMDASGIARSGWAYMTPNGTGEPIGALRGSSDQMGAIMGAFNVIAALLARERYGIGQMVETSHLAASIWLMQCRYQSALYMKSSITEGMKTASRETVTNPIFNYYKCADGEWIALVCSVARHWGPVCAALGIPDSVRDDPRFKDRAARAANARACVAMLDGYFAKKPLAEWIKAFEGKDINWEKVQKFEELPTDPQVIANEYMSDYTHPLTGETYKIINLPLKFSETPAMRLGRAPLLGENTEEILVDILGYKKEDVPGLIDEIGKPVPTPSDMW